MYRAHLRLQERSLQEHSNRYRDAEYPRQSQTVYVLRTGLSVPNTSLRSFLPGIALGNIFPPLPSCHKTQFMRPLRILPAQLSQMYQWIRFPRVDSTFSSVSVHAAKVCTPDDPLPPLTVEERAAAALNSNWRERCIGATPYAR